MSLEQVINLIVKKFKPYSIFLYGSKTTNTDTSYSDYEIGVIFEDENYSCRSEIANVIKDKNYSLFPFKLSDIINFTIDTPFQKNIYMHVLTEGGAKTLYGVSVLEKLQPPVITKEDLLADINFNLGIALSAVRVYKSGDFLLANDLFYKSCLYVTRDYLYFKTGKLCLSYKEIYANAKKVADLKEFEELLNKAYELRNNPNQKEKNPFYYKNISYINMFIIPRMK